MNNKKLLTATPKQQNLLNKIIAQHQAGQLDEAELRYKKLLLVLPTDALLLFNLGTLMLQKSHFEEAVQLLGRSLAVAPNQTNAHYNCGLALYNLKRFDEAVSCYKQELMLNPNDSNAHYNCGLALHVLKRIDEAVICYNHAIQLDPNYIMAHFNCGLDLLDLKRFDEAVICFNQAIKLDPNFSNAHYNCGLALYNLKRFDEAIICYKQVLALDPNSSNAHYHYGLALWELKRFDEAIICYKQVLALDPNSSNAHYNCGLALYALKRFDEAISYYKLALALDPNYINAHYNYGIALHDLKRFDEAIICYNQVLELDPHYVDAYFTRGNSFQSLTYLEDAIASYNQALALNPNYTKAYWNKALTKILSGDYLAAWPLYEYRWQDHSMDSIYLPTSRPLLAAKEKVARLFIWAEQGVGDELFFGTMFNEAQQLAELLIVSVDKRLLALFQRSLPDIHFVDKHKALPETDYDYHLPMGSLGQFFRNSLADFKQHSVAYLQAESVRRNELRKTLGSKQTFICGISWQTTAKLDGLDRSLSLEQLALAIAGPSIKLVSLQYGDVNAEIKQLREQHDIEVEQLKSVDNFNDLEGLAALIDACDLVISVDNSTVHLAGALGKEVWVLLPCEANYRWMVDRDDSPWYPSVKLFRQPRFGDWDSVINTISTSLMLKSWQHVINTIGHALMLKTDVTAIDLSVVPESTQLSISKRDQLIALYTQMAEHGYNTVDNQQIQVAFSDMEIIKFKDTVKLIFDHFTVKTLLDYGCGGSNYHQAGFSGERSAVEFFGLDEVFLYEPARNIDARQQADAVICFDVLEHIFITDIPKVIRELFKYSKKVLIVNVACYKARALLPNGENAHITVRPAIWWKGMFDAIAIEYPDISLQLLCSPQYLHAESFDLYKASDWENSEFFET
jgi:tetratricopeptide (TPR) repeat protein